MEGKYESLLDVVIPSIVVVSCTLPFELVVELRKG